jgi:predicted molibdopterin-dependent oxidoreductase YjgC
VIFAVWLRRQAWEELERRSGLARTAREATATVYASAGSAIGIRAGVDTVQMLLNLLLLLRGNGKPGAGICPVHGHSNVQG